MADQNYSDNLALLQQELQSGEHPLPAIRQSLISAGYAPGDADDMISTASAKLAPSSSGGKSNKDTFLGESGLGGTWEALKGLASQTTDPKNPNFLQPQKAIGELGVNALGGLAQNATDQLGQAWHSATQSPQGSNFGAQLLDSFKNAGQAGQHVLQAIPGGDTLTHLFGNAQEGNWPGLAGDLTALAGPDLLEGGLAKAGEKATLGGLQKYRSQLPFNIAQHSPEDIESATRAAMRERIPAQELFATGKDRTLDRLGDPSKPSSLIGQTEAQIKPYVTGALGKVPINAQTVLSPLLDKIKGVMGVQTAGAQKLSATMLHEVQEELKTWDPQVMGQIFDPNALAPGQPFSSEQKVNLLDKWSQNNQVLDAGQAHNRSRALNNLISDKSYGDTSTSVEPGAVQANKLLRQGYKDGINEVHPEVADLNNHYHDLINLKDTLNQVAKQPSRASQQAMDAGIRGLIGSPIALGAGGLAAWGAHTMGGGPLQMGLAGGAGHQLIKALQDPKMATKAAIILGNDFPKLIKSLQGSVSPLKVALPTFNSLENSGNDPIKELFNAPPQSK
jgi:hypothetical protein